MKIYYYLFLFFLISCSSNLKEEEKSVHKLNVIYIMADDHAYQAISSYGYKVGQLAPTPNIDRLASEGALMNATYCTNSICGPSRS